MAIQTSVESVSLQGPDTWHVVCSTDLALVKWEQEVLEIGGVDVAHSLVGRKDRSTVDKLSALAQELRGFRV